jgi:transposase
MSGFKGRNLQKRLQRFCHISTIEIVKRSDHVSGFVVLPKRWIVERTIAWLNRCRRLAKDWGNSTERRSRSCASPQSARKLCNPT